MRHFRLLPCPYRLAQQIYQSAGMDPYSYGETPLWTIYRLFKMLKLPPGTRVLDLGAGDFKLVFFWETVFGYDAMGIEQIPDFCRHALALKNQLSKEKVTVIEGNFLEMPLPECDVAFLFGSNLSDEAIYTLIDQLRHIPRVITVSYPLSDYSKLFCTQQTFELPFLFGKTTVYLNLQVGLQP